MAQRYSGFKYSDPVHEDFETWYLVCADAEPGWEDTPEGKASARAREEEKRPKSREERETAEHQRKLDAEIQKKEKEEEEEAEKRKQEEKRQRRIIEQEQAARKVAERLAAQEKGAEEQRKKKAAENAERQRVREEEERRVRKAAEAVVRKRLAEEEERRRRTEDEEAAAAHQREEIVDRKRAQASDEQWTRLQTVVQAEYDDLIREHTKLQDDLDAASARRWLEKRRQARLQQNNNSESTGREPQECHTGHVAERKRLAEVSLELADLGLIVKAITNSRTNPAPSSSSGIHSKPPSLPTVRSSPISALTNTNQHNPGQLNTVVSEIRVLTARDDRSDNQSEQMMRDRYDFLTQREEQRRVADIMDWSSSQDRHSPPGWFGTCTMI